MSTQLLGQPSVAQDQQLVLHSYKPPASSNEAPTYRSSHKTTIPPGQQYLAKVNGRLVLAREKSKRKPAISLNLLGEAFGVTVKVTHKRSKSVESPPRSPIIVDGVTYVPQGERPPYSAPLLQQPFPGASQPAQFAQLYPSHIVAPKPTKQDFKQLKKIEAHFKKMMEAEPRKITAAIPALAAAKAPAVVAEPTVVPAKGSISPESPAPATIPAVPVGAPAAEPPAPVPKVYEVKTTVTIIKHICANCGNVRSSRYQYENPIKPGETPLPAYCRKCQRYASSTSCSNDSEDEREERQAKKQKKYKKKGRKSEKTRNTDDLSENEEDPPEPPIAKLSKKDEPHRSAKESRSAVSKNDVSVEDPTKFDKDQNQRTTNHNALVVDDIIADIQTTAQLPKKNGTKHKAAPQHRYFVEMKDMPPKTNHKVRERISENVKKHSPRVLSPSPEGLSLNDRDARSQDMPLHSIENSLYEQPQIDFACQESIKSLKSNTSTRQHSKVQTVDGSETARSAGSRKEHVSEHSSAKSSHIPREMLEIEKPIFVEASRKRHSADSVRTSVRVSIASKRHSADEMYGPRRNGSVEGLIPDIKGHPRYQKGSDRASRQSADQVSQTRTHTSVSSAQPSATGHRSQDKRALSSRARTLTPAWDRPAIGNARNVTPAWDAPVVDNTRPKWDEPIRSSNFEASLSSHYENDPLRRSSDEVEYERQEYIDKANFDTRVRSNRFTKEHALAAKYYQENWIRDEPAHSPETPSINRRHRRDKYGSTEMGGTDDGYDYASSVTPPRVPTPPSAVDEPELTLLRESSMNSEQQVVRHNHLHHHSPDSKSKAVNRPSTIYERSEPVCRPGKSLRRSNNGHNSDTRSATPICRSNRAERKVYDADSSCSEISFSEVKKIERRAEEMVENMQQWAGAIDYQTNDDGWVFATQTELEHAEELLAAQDNLPGFNEMERATIEDEWGKRDTGEW